MTISTRTMITVGVMAVLLIIGIIFVVRHFKNHQHEEGIAYVIIMFAAEVIATSFGTLDDKIFAFLSHKDVGTNYAQLISGFILLALGLFLMLHSKNKMYILNLNGMSHDRRIDNHHKEVGLNPFQFKEKEVDFVRLYNRKMSSKVASEIIQEIKYKVEVFKQESKDKKRGYTGIAAIPFVLLAGKFFNRSVMNEYFEYNKFQQVYYRLTSKKRFPRLTLVQNDAISRLRSANCNEIAIAISITASINNDQLAQFTCPHVFLSVTNPDDNIIKYKEQLKSYVKTTYDLLIDANEKISHLNKIHLIISSQSCFAFELGQLIEDTRIPMVISYQYNTQSEPKYPWGIIINGDQQGKYVQS
ncbi:SAVED domain-containing protein [Paenibacillus tundrae]|uniref:SAVED domain-containing protein n=1 Tax=Paenibacillus tundrae TaxID=528187 RepID=UPI0030CCA31B